jgi:hypothetical protein
MNRAARIKKLKKESTKKLLKKEYKLNTVWEEISREVHDLEAYIEDIHEELRLRDAL